MSSGNGTGPMTAAEVAVVAQKMWHEINAWRSNPLKDAPVAMTMDTRVVAGFCMAIANLWAVARKTSRLRAAWIHHDEGQELSKLLERVDPRLVPVLTELKDPPPEKPGGTD